QSLLEQSDSAELSTLLAIESMSLHPSVDADHVLRSAMALLRRPLGYVQHKKTIRSVSLSLDGMWIATGSDDNTAYISKASNLEKGNQAPFAMLSHSAPVAA